MQRKVPPTTAVQPPAPQPSFRSGAVARMARMPVSTLRIWEQRYRAVGPATAPSGHRLYTAADVERVLLLRRLTGQGFAIGAIAALTLEQLQQVAATQGTSATGQGDRPVLRVAARVAARTAALQLIVVGQALAMRLQRPAVARRLAHPWQVAAVFESLTDAVQSADAASGAVVDLLLWHAPGLQASALPALHAAQDAWHASRVAVTYRFAGAEARSAFAAAGVTLVREPADDDALSAWAATLQSMLLSGADEPDRQPGLRDTPDLAAGDIAPRRFDDAALTAIAGMSPTMVCECPRHVAELLIQLSNFEAYSADCAERNPDDAELHAYLRRVAGASRALFEVALERVARREGLVLP